MLAAHQQSAAAWRGRSGMAKTSSWRVKLVVDENPWQRNGGSSGISSENGKMWRQWQHNSITLSAW